MESVCPNLNNSVTLQGFSVKWEKPGLTGNIQKALITFFHSQWMCEKEWEGESVFRKGLWIKCELVSALLNRLRDWVKPGNLNVPLYFILLFLVSWPVSWGQGSKEKTPQVDLKVSAEICANLSVKAVVWALYLRTRQSTITICRVYRQNKCTPLAWIIVGKQLHLCCTALNTGLS